MKLLARKSFWIRFLLFFCINLLLCFLMGKLLSPNDLPTYLRSVSLTEIIRFSILSFLLAFAFTLWIYSDPVAKKHKERREKKRKSRLHRKHHHRSQD